MEDSPIVINWGPACEHPPKWIGLYDKDPSVSNSKPKAYIETNHKPTGIFETNITIGKLILPDGWNRDDVLKDPPKRNNGKCLPFYVASVDDVKTLRSMDCLTIQPNWMSSNTHLMDVPLKNIFIPGWKNESRFHCCHMNLVFYFFKELIVLDATIRNQMGKMCW